MKKNDKKRPSGCPITYGLDTFGDRWSLLIIRDMMLNDKKTYSDFLGAEEAISTNILADRLKHLEKENIIIKFRDTENRRSYIYSLTEKGRDLAAIVLEIVKWSGKYDERPHARRTVLDQIKGDRQGFENKIRQGLR